MNKKEVLEIRKLLSKDDCRISRICGCYVDGHKEKVAEMKEAFLSLPEEEMFKYTDLLKKTLSGSLGKNLLNLEFSIRDETDKSHHRELMLLRDSGLKDQSLLDAFYDKIIETYLYAENYLILLVHGSYDIPARTSAHEDQFDASDYVYNFILCSICPVSLSKDGLVYDAELGTFVDKVQDWMVQRPEVGFLFPAFNERNTDIHSLLYYTKDTESLHPEITGDLLGLSLPLPAGSQKETFNTFVEETFGPDCDFDLTKTIHTRMNALLEGKKEEPEPTPLDKSQLSRFLSDCGAKADQLSRFEERFDEDFTAESGLLASNLANPKKFEIKTPDIKITVDAERAELLETRLLEDGQEYLCIPISDSVEVNGIRIRSKRNPEI